MRPVAVFRLLLAAVGAVIASQDAAAFLLLGRAWPSGDITMQLQLGRPSGVLLDGSTDWNAVAEAALNDWNDQIGRSKFVVVRDSATSLAQRNGFNNVFFSADIFDQVNILWFMKIEVKIYKVIWLLFFV